MVCIFLFHCVTVQAENRAILQLLHRTPSKFAVFARKPKYETISPTNHKPHKIVNDLGLISLETNLAYYTEDFIFSTLYKDRTDN